MCENKLKPSHDLSKLKQNFEYPYLTNGSCCVTWGTAIKMVCLGGGAMELRIVVFFFPHGVACWLTWSHDTLLCGVCLDFCAKIKEKDGLY